MFKLVMHLRGDDLPPLGQARVQIILPIYVYHNPLRSGQKKRNSKP